MSTRHHWSKPPLALWFCVFFLIGETHSQCQGQELVRYEVVFQGLWTQNTFPKVYPISRPHAEWSAVIGKSHNDDYALFHLGEMISPELQRFVERGDSSLLTAEGQLGDVLDSFGTEALQTGDGETRAFVFVERGRTRVSMVAKITPSPDWFVGIDSIDLCSGGVWSKQRHIDLYPMDGGTQQGYTFSSPKWRSDPQEEITEITNTFPNHTADAFYYPHLDRLAPIARLAIRLVSSYASKDDADRSSTQPAKHSHQSEVGVRKHNLRPPVPDLYTKFFKSSLDIGPEVITDSVLAVTTRRPTPERPLKVRTPTTTHTPTLETRVWPNSPSTGHHETVTIQTTTVASSPPPPREIFIDDQIDDGDNEAEGSGYTEVRPREKPATLTRTKPTRASIPHIAPAIQTNLILPPDDDTAYSQSKECQVSDWSDWSECSRTCGYGVKTRTRQIVRWTGNVACPELTVDQLCGSMKKCNWNHFSLTFNSTQSIVSQGRRRPLIKDGQERVRSDALRGRSNSQKMKKRREKVFQRLL